MRQACGSEGISLKAQKKESRVPPSVSTPGRSPTWTSRGHGEKRGRSRRRKAGTGARVAARRAAEAGPPSSDAGSGIVT